MVTNQRRFIGSEAVFEAGSTGVIGELGRLSRALECDGGVVRRIGGDGIEAK